MLVRRKLAACCNIIPGLTSIYEWEGKICNDSELLLMIKSTRQALPALTAAVQTEHSYSECEVIAVPVVGGSQSYMDWVVNSVKPEGESDKA
jgi:periplasmic divalent cation tolerance protein